MGIRSATGCALALAVPVWVAGCGAEEDHVNRERPAGAINVTAAIAGGRINVSPRTFGAGPIRLIVSNQTPSAQALTFETDDGDAGLTRTTAPIDPSATATLEVEPRPGDYAISTSDGDIRPAAVTVGAARASSQNELLQP